MQVSKEHLYVLGNWKMAQGFASGREFFEAWASPADEKVYAAIYASFPHLLTAQDLCKKNGLFIGAQDCSDQEGGAYTGEVSCQQLSEIGVESVLIAHSERRQRFSEDNELIRRKIERALHAGLTPVFCLGEDLQQRESGRVEGVLQEQLKAIEGLKGDLIIAYEPVWAIGTGKVATTKEIEEAHSFIAAQQPKFPIVYGGSVKPETAAEIMALRSVNGVLVGGASLKVESFEQIFQSALSL